MYRYRYGVASCGHSQDIHSTTCRRLATVVGLTVDRVLITFPRKKSCQRGLQQSVHAPFLCHLLWPPQHSATE